MKKVLIQTMVIMVCLFLYYSSIHAQVKTNFNNKTLIDEKGHFFKSYKEKIDYEIAAKNINDLILISDYKEIKHLFLQRFLQFNSHPY
jgi:hypothetical protein